ncbi:hypothetical protein Syn8016DRAFT_0499 [Synechococcus sp. WH 8016]|nr:hypothetical protein Syn8016DRAFT_0499 [Synechococcus sp. WH 8016]
MARYIFKRKSKVNKLATILPAALVILGTAILLESLETEQLPTSRLQYHSASLTKSSL